MRKSLAIALSVLFLGLSLSARERFIYVARHCQTGGQDMYQPVKNDTGVTQLGIKQAHALGRGLKAIGFHGPIFSSPYFRTTATACYAAEECGSKVYPDARVQECVHKNGGNIKGGGATLATLRELFPQQIAADAKLADNWLLAVKEDYEKEQQARLELALDELLKEHPDDDIMIVSHAGAVAAYTRIMAWRCGLEAIPGTVWNCALFKYKIDDNGKYGFVGYDVSFMSESEISSNQKYMVRRGEGKANGESYDFLMFSDPHFGDSESYDMNPYTNPKYRTRKDIYRAGKAMPFYRGLFEHMAKGEPFKFVIECGDLIEGGGFNAQTHGEQLQKTMAFLQGYFKVPFYPVMGNHDAWGNGGLEAFGQVMCPLISREIGKEVKNANYTFTVGPDVYIAGDIFTPAANYIDYIIKQVKALKTRPRYLFILVHPNIVPFPNKSLLKLCDILAQYDAIILCGHTHQTQLIDYERDGHKLTQFTIGTLLSDDMNRNHYSIPKTDITHFMESFKKNYVRTDIHKENFARQWESHITRYWKTNGMGAARISVSDDGIVMQVQSADLTQEPFTVKVR